MNLKVTAALMLLVTVTPVTAFAKPLSGNINNDPSGCYMQSASGQIINLSSLCGASNHNNVSPNSSYSSPTYERRSYNRATSGSTREIINPSTSENLSTDINKVREEIDRQMFGGLNNGYDSSGACVNQANSSNYRSSQCGGNANQQRRNSSY